MRHCGARRPVPDALRCEQCSVMLISEKPSQGAARINCSMIQIINSSSSTAHFIFAPRAVTNKRGDGQHAYHFLRRRRPLGDTMAVENIGDSLAKQNGVIIMKQSQRSLTEIAHHRNSKAESSVTVATQLISCSIILIACRCADFQQCAEANS